MATPNPLEKTHHTSPPDVSKKTFTIGGILTTVFGLDELLTETKNVSCLWLLNPRLQSQECMAPIARAVVSEWNQRLKQKKEPGQASGLIAVSFDQRNHGSREIDPIANQAWKSGNERHAQDMFSIFHGTSLDTSQLITYLSSYIFPDSARTLSSHMVLGISLGGHAAWHCLFHEPRITTGVVIIGCPDYIRLMSDRAYKSKRKTYTESDPPGSRFLGSVDFPKGLTGAVGLYDPVGLCLGTNTHTKKSFDEDPSTKEQERLVPLLARCIEGKRILNLAGGADKLVPYKHSEPFLRWLKRAVSPDGWFNNKNVILEDIVEDGIGHETSPAMLKEAIRFMVESLEGASPKTSDMSSKI